MSIGDGAIHRFRVGKIHTRPRLPQPITAIVTGAEISFKSCGMAFAFDMVEVPVPESFKALRL